MYIKKTTRIKLIMIMFSYAAVFMGSCGNGNNNTQAQEDSAQAARYRHIDSNVTKASRAKQIIDSLSREK
jgi:hypothetical protein